jgi:hypothetical protein
MTKHKVNKERLMQERGYICECCNDEPMTELHHCIFHRMKDHPELDCKENFQGVGERCHHRNGKANSYVNKVAFWAAQCERYGEDHMIEWLAGLDIKIKPRFERINDTTS